MITSFRRLYLDQNLEAQSFSGDVLDVGGKRANPRGRFRPPTQSVRSWKYLSIDPETQPDFCCSAENIPVPDAQFDSLLLCEVAEHLENPERVLTECHRVLRAGGQFLMSMPFLFGIHADPHDFQRWTGAKIRKALTAAGFSHIEISPMGGIIAVFVDLFEHYCHLEFSRQGKTPVWMRGLRFIVRRLFLKALVYLDPKFPFKESVTTGYFVVARK